MADKTKIQWCDSTWNPVTGCSPVSEGCRNCYAARMAARFPHIHDPVAEFPFSKIIPHEDRLDQPMHWKKPRRIFLCSMGDLFHEQVPDDFITSVFGKMTLCEQHIFIILTKRPDRMNRYIETTWGNQMYGGFPNVWLGVTAENQEEADKRIPILLRTPAAKRFVSCEPLLSPINFFVPGHRITGIGAMALRLGIDWVIVGGESGPGARPMRPEWVRDVRKQCVVAGVPFFFKQWGEWLHDDEALCPGECSIGYHAQGDMLRIGKRRAGRELDGRTWEEFPK